MKSQGMPMQTIALIIIVIIVLAGVAIFFFVYFGKGKGVVGTQTDYSKCKNLCMNAQSDIEIGDWDGVKSIKDTFSTGDCKNYNCKVTIGENSCNIKQVDTTNHHC